MLLIAAVRECETCPVGAQDFLDRDDQRFERQSLRVFIDTLAGADADVDALAAAAEQVGAPGSDERLRAVAAAAIARTRLLLARGERDWTAPLLEAQARIGPRSRGILRSDTWLLRFRGLAFAGAAVIAIGATITWVFR
jgi:hypothetical protein